MASTIQTVGQTVGRLSASQSHLSSLFISVFWATWLLVGFVSPAYASLRRIVVEMPVADPSQYRALISQAESLANERIRQVFQQIPETLTLSLTVLGSQNGNIIPILTTTVSIDQWALEPDVKRWTKYENVYALFRGPERPLRRTVIAAVPRRTFNGPQGIWARMDSAFDQGVLPMTEVHRYLDHWD